MLYRFQPDFEAKRLLTIERADSRDRGPSTSNKGNPGGKGSAGGNPGSGKVEVPQGQRPMTLNPFTGAPETLAPNAPNPFTTGGGFNLHQKITPGGTGAGAAPPAAPQTVDPNVIQQQGGRVVLDPYTAQPLGTPDPYGPAMLGGPMGAPVTQEALNSQQAIGMARAGLAPAGSEALGNALNARGYYNDAMKRQNEGGFGGWLARNASLMGFEQAPVNLDQPQSYAGGSPQLGVNPPGMLGSIAGGVMGFPGLGTAMGAAYSAFGGKDAILTGPQAYSPYSGQPVNSQPRNLPPGFRASGGGAAGAAGGSIPSSTPSATAGSPASQPLQAQPAQQTQSSGPQSAGQQSAGGRTVISGANTVAWPWNSINS